MTKATTHRTVKHSAGSYTRTDGQSFVTVKFHDHLHGWIAAAEWDRYLYTDPVATKRDAVRNADHMIAERV